MPLEQLTRIVSSHLPMAAIVAGGLLLFWGQRARLRAWMGLWRATDSRETPLSKETTENDNKTEVAAHEAYACLRRLLNEVADCPNATDALRLLVLPALVDGSDPPHYRLMWEGKS